MKHAWLGLLLAAAAWRLILFVGPHCMDDFMYSRAAQAMVEGRFHVADQFSAALRVGPVGAIAACYRLLGPGPFTMGLFSLLMSLLEVGLTYPLARRFLDQRGALLSMAFVAAFPLHVFYATKPYSDVPLAALTTLAVLCFLDGRYLLAGLVLGGGHLVKESAFLGLAVMAVMMGRPRWTHLRVLAGFAVVVAGEMGVYAALTGDPLLRVHQVAKFQTRTMAAYYPAHESLEFRLLGRFLMTLFHPRGDNFACFMLFPVAAAAGAVAALVRRERAWAGPALWIVVYLLLVNFWPLRLRPYLPASFGQARLLMVLVVPMSMLAAYALGRWRWACAALMGTAMAASVVLWVDGREASAGARLAWEHLPADAVVVSDYKTREYLELYDGYRGGRRWELWSKKPAGPCVVVVNEANGRGRGYEPPPDWVRSLEGPVFEGVVTGRPHLHNLRREAPRRVAIYRR